MKTNTIEKVKILKEHLFNAYPDGKFSANSYAFNNVLGIKGQTNIYLDILIKEGFLIKTKKAIRGSKSWYPAEYEIIGYLIDDVNVESKNEIESKIEDNEEIHSKVDVNDFIEKNFNGIPMRLYKTEKGYVIPITDIVNALDTSRQHLHKLLKENEELFNNWVVNLTLTTDSAKNKCLTRDGIIGLLMKISYNRLTPDKKKLVLEFQKWAIEKLGLLMSTGEVKISSQEQHNIKTNVANTIGVSDEDIEKLLTNIRNSLDDNIKKVKSLFDSKNEEVLLAKSERDIANEREKQVLAKVSQMV